MNAYIALEYDAFAIDPSSAEALGNEMSSLGPVRVRHAYKDRGGDFTVLWIVATFIGLEYAKAFIAGVATAHVNALSEKVRAFFRRGDQRPSPVPCVYVRVSVDDLDIGINLPRELPKDYLHTMIRRVVDHLSREPLASRAVRYVVLPMRIGEDGWVEADEWSVTAPEDRYWGIGEGYAPGVTAIYDSARREILPYFYSLTPSEQPPQLSDPASV